MRSIRAYSTMPYARAYLQSLEIYPSQCWVLRIGSESFFLVGSPLHYLHDLFFMHMMKTNVLFLSCRVHFWDLRLTGSLGFLGSWNMVTSDGYSGWSHGAGCGVAFLKMMMILSICLPCPLLFPSLSLWDFAAGGDGKHPVPKPLH